MKKIILLIGLCMIFLLVGMVSAFTACYGFDGNGYEYLGNYDVTAGNGANYAGSAKLGSGAASFDGIDDYLKVNNGLNLTRIYTVVAWINPLSGGGGTFGRVFAQVNDSTGGVSAWVNDGSNVFLEHTSTVNIGASTNNDVTMGSYNFVVFQYNGTGQIYINTTYDMADNNISAPIQDTNDFYIGNRYSTYTRGFNGTIDQMVVYAGEALNSGNITELYNSGTGLICADIAGVSNEFYFSNSGIDSSTTCNATNPCATIKKYNMMPHRPGDKYYFECGSSWRLPDAWIDTYDGNRTEYISYTSYGNCTGSNKPLFLASVNLSSSSNWTNASSSCSNCWNSTGNISQDVGSVFYNNGTLAGDKEANKENLTEQGHFFYDDANDRLMIYSTSNPSTAYSNIEASTSNGKALFDLTGIQNVNISGLHLKYDAYGGIGGEYQAYIIVRDCEIEGMGGSYQSGTTRSGNCLGGTTQLTNITYLRNNISDCWDSGIAPHIPLSSGIKTMKNTLIAYNIVKNCAWGIEYFSSNVSSTTNNTLISHNTVINSGGGVFSGHYARNLGSCMRLDRSPYFTNDFNVINNICYNSSHWDMKFGYDNDW